MLPGVLRKGRFLEGNNMINWPVPSSVVIQHMRRRGVTACDKYTVIYPIQNILRLLEVHTETRGRNLN